jgi:hypothetical protein
MTEPETPPPAPIPEPVPALGHEDFAAPIADPVSPVAPEPTTSPNRAPLVIGVILFLLLAGGEAWLFHAQSTASDQGAAVATLTSRVAALKTDVADLQSKLAATDDKIAAIAHQPTPAAAPPQVKVVDKVPAALGDQVNTIADQIKTMQAGIAAITTTALADHANLATLQSNAADLPKLVARAQTLAELAQASLALQTGTSLGTIQGAPEALVRYATVAPPTLAGLKASFPDYARKAALAGGDVASGGGFWQRAKSRVESLVTIRQNARVLVGSRAAGTLGAAQTDLDRDDLAGAVADLKPLPAAAQSVMAPWTEQAERLIAARKALATMAAQAASDKTTGAQ